MTFSAYDSIIGRNFTAPSREALAELMNHPRLVSWRASIHRRIEETKRLNDLYRSDNIAVAQAKLDRKNQKRLLHANG